MAVLQLVDSRIESGRSCGWLDRPITRNGLLCSVALPVGWLVLFYAFVLHVRLALGRWPAFGESLTDWPLSWHFTGVTGLGLVLFYSLFILPAAFILCVPFRRSRHFAVHMLCYAAAVALTFAGMNLAPGPFLNWFFD